MFATARGGDRWELREAISTERGPRSRTLASFRVLTPDIVELARDRAREELNADHIRQIARKAGAPVAEPPADAAAGRLLGELARGRRPRPAIARLIVDALAEEQAASTDAERAVAEWIGASPAERGDALRDLLLLTDSLPARREGPLVFPGVSPKAP